MGSPAQDLVGKMVRVRYCTNNMLCTAYLEGTPMLVVPNTHPTVWRSRYPAGSWVLVLKRTYAVFSMPEDLYVIPDEEQDAARALWELQHNG